MAKVLADDRAGIPEKELIQRSQQGDSSAFRLVYQRYQKRVRSTLYQLCGSQVLDDLVQEVFFKVWKGLPKFRQTSTFSTWLYRIVWNVAHDQRRRFAQNPEETSELVYLSLSRPQDSPNLMALHYQELVQQGLQTLSLEHRIVLILHDLEDLPQKEVAQILDLPVGTVKSRLFHSRKAIRNFLQKQGESL